MKMSNFFGLILISSLTFALTSCEKYEDDILNGVVHIEMEKTPENKSIISSTQNSFDLKINFSTHTNLQSVSVALFVEDESKFNITESSVELKEDSCLDYISSDENIIDFLKTDVNEKEYIFETTVDLSEYPSGTCFVLFGSAQGESTHTDGGTDLKGIYFCKSSR